MKMKNKYCRLRKDKVENFSKSKKLRIKTIRNRCKTFCKLGHGIGSNYCINSCKYFEAEDREAMIVWCKYKYRRVR